MHGCKVNIVPIHIGSDGKVERDRGGRGDLESGSRGELQGLAKCVYSRITVINYMITITGI